MVELAAMFSPRIHAITIDYCFSGNSRLQLSTRRRNTEFMLLVHRSLALLKVLLCRSMFCYVFYDDQLECRVNEPYKLDAEHLARIQVSKISQHSCNQVIFEYGNATHEKNQFSNLNSNSEYFRTIAKLIYVSNVLISRTRNSSGRQKSRTHDNRTSSTVDRPTMDPCKRNIEFCGLSDFQLGRNALCWFLELISDVILNIQHNLCCRRYRTAGHRLSTA